MFRRLSGGIATRHADEVMMKYRGIKNLTALGLAGRAGMMKYLFVLALMLGLGVAVYLGSNAGPASAYETEDCSNDESLRWTGNSVTFDHRPR